MKVKEIKQFGDSGWRVSLDNGGQETVAFVSAMDVVNAAMSETARDAVVAKLATEPREEPEK